MKLTTFIRVAGLAVSMTGLAFAESVVLYNLANNQVSTPTTGTVSFGISGPNANVLVGSNIAIKSLSRVSPTAGPAVACFGCILTFTSGALLPGGYTSGGIWPGSSWGMSPVWAFGMGGTASITGVFDSNGNNVLDLADIAATGAGPLLSGSFINSTTVTGNSITDLVVGAGLILNSQNTGLNNLLFNQSLSGPIWTGSLNMRFNPFGSPAPPGGTAALQTFRSERILNGSLVNSTPEPGSVLLFSSITGILGFGLVMRRRRANQTNS